MHEEEELWVTLGQVTATESLVATVLVQLREIEATIKEVLGVQDESDGEVK